MHILYIHQYFSTPSGPRATRPYEFSRLWIEKGHKVTVLTTTVNLMSEDLRNCRGKFVKKLDVEGIKVFAFRIPYNQKMGKMKRYLSWLAFLFVSVIATLFITKVDLIYARSTPLTVGIPAVVAKRLKGIPFVFDVTDQWPAVPIEIGFLRNKVMIKWTLWLEKTIYQYSSSIVACSPGMADGIREVMTRNNLPQKPITVIPNLAHTDLFRPDINGSEIRKERGWNDKFLLLHAGTMGTINSLGFVVDAALKLRDYSDILFVLIGGGKERPALDQRIKELGLANVQILQRVPREELPSILAAANVSLVIVANHPILEHNSASKFFDALSAGNPILLNYSGWQREILEENRAGFGCELCNLDEFVEKVLYFNSHRHKLIEMGQNARRIAEEKFSRAKLTAEALEVINSV